MTSLCFLPGIIYLKALLIQVLNRHIHPNKMEEENTLHVSFFCYINQTLFPPHLKRKLFFPDQKQTSNPINQQEILLHPSHASLYPHSHVTLKPPHVHPIPPTHIQCEPMLIQHSVLTPLLTANTSILNSNNNGNRSDPILLNRDSSNQNLINGNRETILLSRNDTAILLNSEPQILNTDGQLANKTQLINSPSPLLSSSVGVLNSNISNSVLLNQNNNPPLLHSPTGSNLLTQSPQRTSPALNTASNNGQTTTSLPPSNGMLNLIENISIRLDVVARFEFFLLFQRPQIPASHQFIQVFRFPVIKKENCHRIFQPPGMGLCYMLSKKNRTRILVSNEEANASWQLFLMARFSGVICHMADTAFAIPKIFFFKMLFAFFDACYNFK